MKRLLVVLATALAALAVVPVASAHRAAITITCEAVTFSYTSFPQGESTADEVVVVNGTATERAFTFAGPSAADVIALGIVGNAHVDASTSWGADGGG
jgi:hypothetical protein